jgi:hypothetical protein
MQKYQNQQHCYGKLCTSLFNSEKVYALVVLKKNLMLANSEIMKLPSHMLLPQVCHV